MSTAQYNISIVRASGEHICEVTLSRSDLVICLRRKAEEVLGCDEAILVSPLGEVLSDAQSLRDAQLNHEDVVQLIENAVTQKGACTRNAFAYVKNDSSVITWGDSGEGGDRMTSRATYSKSIRLMLHLLQ